MLLWRFVTDDRTSALLYGHQRLLDAVVNKRVAGAVNVILVIGEAAYVALDRVAVCTHTRVQNRQQANSDCRVRLCVRPRE
jgi:hypothetical protein